MAQEIAPFRAIAAEPLQSIPVRDTHFLAECLVKPALCLPTPTTDVSKSCDICGKTFSSYRALGGHKSVHNNNKRTHDEPLKKKSRKRSRSSETECASSSLDEEQVVSSSKGPYECDICGKTFSAYQALGGHKSNHSHKRPTCFQLFPENPGQTTSTLHEAEGASSCPEEPGEIDLELRLFPESPAQTVATSYKTHTASSCAKGPGEIDLELRLGTMIK